MYKGFQPTFPPPPAHSPLVLGLAIVVPVLLLVAGLGMFLWVKRRQFYRTKAAGLEAFKNFRSLMIARFVEVLALYLGVLLLGASFFSGVWVISLF